ncbi:MAG: hypothetical protein ACOZCL_14800 [Bacillota bacterium]
MKFNFQFFGPSSGAPIVSIASYGITFNSSAIEMLKKPKRILIGFDVSKKVLGFIPVEKDEDDPAGRSYAFAERERNGVIRISNKDFLMYVSNKTGVDFSKSVKYAADWLEEERTMVIELNSPLDSGSDTEMEEE